jgi:hypothetical protein
MFSGTPGTLAESTALYSRDFSDEEFWQDHSVLRSKFLLQWVIHKFLIFHHFRWVISKQTSYFNHPLR